jgi:hypothetical protein
VPNYGYVTPGANASPINGIWAQEINVTAGGTLNSISIYLQSSGSPLVALGLYSNQAGSPDIPLTLLASGSGSPPSGVTGWFTVSMSAAVTAGLYWIAVQASVTNTITGYYDGGQAGANIYYNTGQAWTGSLPSTYPAGSTLSNDLFGFYATVTSGGAPQTVTPTGIPSTNAFGNPTLTIGLGPSGIPSTNAFGSPTVSASGTVTITPSGIPSTNAFGFPAFSGGILSTSPAQAPRQGDTETRSLRKINSILYNAVGP